MTDVERAQVIAEVMALLASTSDATVIGATLILPTGEVLYVSADDARALHAPQRPAGGAR